MGRVNNQTDEALFSQMGKIPPQDLETEQTILGAILLESTAFSRVSETLKPTTFYKQCNQEIYRAMEQLVSDNEPIDLRTVKSRLEKNGVLEVSGGAYYLAELTQMVNSASNIESHSRIITEMYMRRELIKVSMEVQDLSYNGEEDVFLTTDKALVKIDSLVNGNVKGGFQHLSKGLTDTVELMFSNRELEITGEPTGLKALDKVTGGWQKTELIIIAARPGMGKTALVVTCIKNAAELGVPVGLFSLEMSTNKVVRRLISSDSGIPLEKVIKPKSLNNYEWDRVAESQERLSKLPIYIDDTIGLNLMELRSKATRLVLEFGVRILVVDYLQLMSDSRSDGNREAEISRISRSLKALAKDLDIPVIALSQLSRSVESRGGEKRPLLSDLRESGSIEQDADMVLFLYRPEYYNVTTGNNLEGEEISLLGQAEIIIGKHREGALGSLYLKFIGHLTKFEDNIQIEETEEIKPPELNF